MLSWVYTVKQAGLSIYCYKGWPYAIVLHRLVWVGVYCYTDSPGWMFEPSAMLDASNYSYPHSVTPVTITQTGMWGCILLHRPVWVGIYCYTDWSDWVYEGWSKSNETAFISPSFIKIYYWNFIDINYNAFCTAIHNFMKSLHVV